MSTFAPYRCPLCGELLEATTVLHDGRAQPGGAPAAGDIDICWYCLGILVHDGGGVPRAPSDAVRQALEAEPDVAVVRYALVLYKLDPDHERRAHG